MILGMSPSCGEWDYFHLFSIFGLPQKGTHQFCDDLTSAWSAKSCVDDSRMITRTGRPALNLRVKQALLHEPAIVLQEGFEKLTCVTPYIMFHHALAKILADDDEQANPALRVCACHISNNKVKVQRCPKAFGGSVRFKQCFEFLFLYWICPSWGPAYGGFIGGMRFPGQKSQTILETII